MNLDKKRLGIFAMYDPQGVVDDYIPYLLEDMCKNLSHLVIVCNGFVNGAGLATLKKFTKDVFIRENKGFDATAIKEVLTNLYGWEMVYHFNELVIFNDSFYGPLYPFKTVFDEMDKRKADMWGLTAQHEMPDSLSGEREYLPFHIQSFFLVVRERLLKSDDYRTFWETLEELNTFTEAAIKYEVRLSEYLRDKGYICDSYVDITANAAESIKNNYFFSFENAYEIILKYKCPVLKRKVIARDSRKLLKVSNGIGISRLTDYIKKNTTYDTNLIWDNALRVFDIANIRTALYLDRVLPSHSRNAGHIAFGRKKAAVVINSELSADLHEYLEQIPDSICVETLSEDNGINALISHCKHIFDKYEYICFINANACKTDDVPGIAKESKISSIFENTLKSTEYIENIINEFEQAPRLGLLTVPAPVHSKYFSLCGEKWGGDFDAAQALAEKLKLRRLSPLKRPFMIELAFWCRADALSTLFELEPDSDQSAVTKILPYIAQRAGFYSAVVMTDDYAALQSVNREYMLSEILNAIGISSTGLNFNDFLNWLTQKQMLEFCARCNQIYIYGAGGEAKKCTKVLESVGIVIKGFIVSDGKPKANEINGHKVCYLSEAPEPDERLGVILGMDRNNSAQVMPLLEAKGHKNIFLM